MVDDDPGVVALTLGSAVITTTLAHPFFIVGRGWVTVAHLVPGDRVRRADGTGDTVTAVRVVQVPHRMYNLTVAVAHTFFVGAGGWLVHNAGGCAKARVRDGHVTLDYGDWTSEYDLRATLERIQRGDTSVHNRDGTSFNNPAAKGLPPGNYTE